MTRADKLLLAALLCSVLVSGAALYGRSFLWASGPGTAQAVVSVKGQVLRRIELSPGTRSSFTVEGARGASTVEVADGRVRMRQAPCAGGICVSQGWIARPGESIVCIPGEILVRIEGAAPLDAVTR